MDLKEIESVFYPHHLAREVQRRKEAIELFNQKNYSAIRTNYVHYYNSKTVEIELENSLIDDVVKELQAIKADLPDNSTNVHVTAGSREVEGGFGCGNPDTEGYTYVSYNVVTISDSEKCKGLAKNWSSQMAWKIKHQPNEKDGKRAQELYDQLTK